MHTIPPQYKGANPRDEFLARYSAVSEIYGKTPAARMLDWLEEHSFFSTPASSSVMYHNAFPGGLAFHSINVYDMMAAENRLMAESPFSSSAPYPDGVIAVVALLHDICKCGAYRMNDGTNPSKPPSEYPYLWSKEFIKRNGHEHGELSARIVKSIIGIGEEEEKAIEWHMGMFDHRLSGAGKLRTSELRNRYLEARRQFDEAWSMYPLVPMTVSADAMAARVIEKGMPTA